jgi:hypothetical protein
VNFVSQGGFPGTPDVGEHWTEPPAYRPISEKPSKTEPASLFAAFVVDTTDGRK